MSSSADVIPAEGKPRYTEAVSQRRPAYRADLADGVDRFFEARRTSCPWCASERLTERLRTSDLLQHKPGRFRLDRCQHCGHVFQNPRLNEAGLEFYYRDFYDGLGEQRLGDVFAGRASTYRGRAWSMLPFASAPENWLDVGTGHGHFCEAARDVYPE